MRGRGGGAAARGEGTDGAALPTRQFAFHYGATISGLMPGERCRIWVPVATSNEHQEIRLLERPADGEVAKEARYGNTLWSAERVVPTDGKIDLDFAYAVKRLADRGSAAAAGDERYLAADTRVPVGGKAMGLLTGKTLPTEPDKKAHELYDVVYDHMEYRKDKPGWGTGDAEWACVSGYGNCTDFHSLFMALCRGEGMPAKFEIGFMVPRSATGAGKVAGYHCWAQFKPNGASGHWMPVDISDAREHPEKRRKTFGALDENRVMFSTGRDLELVPKQAGGPVNFLVYPYVEVGAAAQVWGQDKIAKRFTYQDDK